MSRSEPESVVSAGVRWAHRITTIGLEFALPPLLGGYLDRRWGLGSALTIVGAILGFGMGWYHLVAISRELASEPKISRKPDVPVDADKPG